MKHKKYSIAAEWVRCELNRLLPRVVLDRPTDYSVENLSDSPRETKVIEPSIGAVRSEDAVLLRKLGYPAIPDRQRAYNDYCELDHDTQGQIVRSLLAAGKENKVIWEEATILVEQMDEMYKRGFEHPHYRDIKFEFNHLRPKRFPKLTDPQKDQRTLIISNLVGDVHAIFGISVWHDGCNDKTVCSSSIVADVWSAYFPNENISARTAKDMYYSPKPKIRKKAG